ncbi:hypothetical protein OEZ85_014147 [Tetradesmus obliquus]|uniref:dolichol kinase n=1 Tax=Tetradesmus obliquus TaxID=3088 RepID=A0ABY8U731_TETOB|nr:hypothetical protein OEZ85_014147 [Tetradesmus obliquus]
MAAATHAKSAAGWCRPQLQGHQLEIALICASGLRLCLAAEAAGCSWLACCLALVHLLPLLLEFGSKQKLVSPYSLRRSDSHGLAQGVLAVPSVLAALAAAAPQQGSWSVWALASCVAAAAIVLTVYLQSKPAAAAVSAAAATKQSGSSSSSGTQEFTTAQKSNAAATSSSGLLGRVLLAVPLAASMVALLLWLVCAAAWTLLEFMPARQGRVLVLLYWVGLMGLTLPALGLWVGHSKVPQIIVRKVYHLLAGGLFVPVFFWDLPMLCLSLAIAFAALQLLEVVRHLQLPRLGAAVEQFMQDFVDERDSGVIYVTHFTLLLGLAVPMKTVEGTVAGIASSLGAWCLLLWAGGMGVPGGMSWCWWLQLVLATAGAGLMEAVTSQLDNVLLPLWYLPHLLLVQQ